MLILPSAQEIAVRCPHQFKVKQRQSLDHNIVQLPDIAKLLQRPVAALHSVEIFVCVLKIGVSKLPVTFLFILLIWNRLDTFKISDESLLPKKKIVG